MKNNTIREKSKKITRPRRKERRSSSYIVYINTLTIGYPSSLYFVKKNVNEEINNSKSFKIKI